VNVNEILGETVRQYRRAVDMTQEEFAAEIGVEAQHVSSVECGVKKFSLEKLLAIREKFQLSIDEMLPVSEPDESLKEKWIDEITENLRAMDTIQVGIWKRMIASRRD